MPGEDEVSTVDMLTIDGQTEAGEYLDNPVDDLGRGDGVVQLLVAVVLGVGGGEHRDDHGDGSVAVQEAHDDADTTNDYKPGICKTVYS